MFPVIKWLSFYFQIRYIEVIRLYTTEDARKPLVCSLVTSCFDYGKVVLYGVHEGNLVQIVFDKWGVQIIFWGSEGINTEHERNAFFNHI
jgi:hypothetical protein